MTNPLLKYENLTAFFEQDKDFRNTRDLALAKFKKEIKPDFVSNFNLNWLRTLQYFSSHIGLSIVLGVALIGGVGVSAAEIIFPQDLKPSRILRKAFSPEDFETNLQPQTDPYTKLAADDQNPVVVSGGCGLAIKYPRFKGDTYYYAYTNAYQSPAKEVAGLKDSVLVYGYSKDNLSYGSINIDCFDLQKIEAYNQNLDSIYKTGQGGLAVEGGEFDWQRIGQKAPATIEKLRNQTGWFIYQGELENVYTYSNLQNQSFYNMDLDQNIEFISFDYGNQRYQISYLADKFDYKKENEMRQDYFSKQRIRDESVVFSYVLGRDIQLQLQSLSESEKSIELGEKFVNFEDRLESFEDFTNLRLWKSEGFDSRIKKDINGEFIITQTKDDYTIQVYLVRRFSPQSGFFCYFKEDLKQLIKLNAGWYIFEDKANLQSQLLPASNIYLPDDPNFRNVAQSFTNQSNISDILFCAQENLNLINHPTNTSRESYYLNRIEVTKSGEMVSQSEFETIKDDVLEFVNYSVLE